MDEAQIAGDPVTTDRWIKAVAVRPHQTEGRYVFHHANPALIMPGEAMDPMEAEANSIKLIDSAVGTEGRIYPEEQGRLLRPGSTISWGLHYHPYSFDVEAALQVAVWFYPEGYVPEHYSMGDVSLRTGAETHAAGFPPAAEPGTRAAASTHTRTSSSRRTGSRPSRACTCSTGRPWSTACAGICTCAGSTRSSRPSIRTGAGRVLTKLNWDHGWHTLFLYEDDVMPLLPRGPCS